MMNIAFFSKQLPSDHPNGVSVQVHRLADALVTIGHTVTIYSFSPPPDAASYTTVTLAHRAVKRLQEKFSAAKAFSQVDTSDFDILHYHGDDYLSSGSPRRVRTFYGSALREAVHAKTPGRFFYQSLFYLFEWISCLKKGSLTAISDDTQKALPLVKTTIPCSVPLTHYHPQGPKTPYPSLLFLGDFNSRKRGATLLSIFHTEIRPRFPDAQLTVVGPAPCSGDGIRYVGRLSEESLIDAYRRHWLLCMPSSYEGFGVPMIESMACGTPVVATENPGSRTLIRHERNGLICSEPVLGSQINNLLSNATLRKTITAEGRNTAKEFDTNVIACKYETLYHAITARLKIEM